MAREIELKIRLDDPRAFRAKLVEKALPEGAYHKADTYYKGSGGAFRLRESDGRAVVCRKEKTIQAGIEVNRETEFTVDDPAAFREFARGLGFKEVYRKEKTGQAWRWGEILIEEGTVSHLGWFAEFELILDEGRDTASVNRARSVLLAALESLGVGKDRIEPRTYAELLGQRKK